MGGRARGFGIKNYELGIKNYELRIWNLKFSSRLNGKLSLSLNL
jgi:hypothetical protein